MTTFVTSRTHAQDYLNCKRFRFYRTLYRGTGLGPVRSSIPLVVGSSVHAAIECILQHTMDGHCTGNCTQSVDYAVEQGLKYYDDECARRELQIDAGEELPFVMQEQRAMIEAIVRGWIAFILPQLLAEYNVVGIEREDTFKLGEWKSPCPRCHGTQRYYVEDAGDGLPDSKICYGQCKLGYVDNDLWWQSRADIDLQSKRTGELYVASIKNLKEWKRIQEVRSAIDMQGHSETYAAEQARQTPYAGIQMIINVKGQYKKPWSFDDQVESGPRTYQSFLVHPWMKQGITSDGDSFAWNDKYSCIEPHVMGGGKKCPGYKNHKLGKEWSKVNIWEVMTIKEWIALLASGTVQGSQLGESPFNHIMILPAPHSRNKSAIDSWLRQVRVQEVQVAQDGEVVNALDEGSPEYIEQLDARFPMNTDFCLRFSENYKCDLYSVCHEGVSLPLDSGLYQIRSPHHELEKQLFRERGFEV